MQLSWLDDAAIETRPLGFAVSIDELRFPHLRGKGRAGHTRRRYLQNDIADKQTITNCHHFVVELIDDDVLTEFAMLDRSAKILSPPAQRNAALDVDGLIRTAMISPVTDSIPLQPLEPQRQRLADRVFIDPGLMALPRKRLGMTDTDGKHAVSFVCRST